MPLLLLQDIAFRCHRQMSIFLTDEFALPSNVSAATVAVARTNVFLCSHVILSTDSRRTCQ